MTDTDILNAYVVLAKAAMKGRPVRIAFAGASGTGKTTLTNILASALAIPVCPVGSRTVAAAMGFSSPYDVDTAGVRGEFQQRLLTEKAEWEAAHDSFITDRTHLDNLVYCALHSVYDVNDKYVDRVFARTCRYTDIIVTRMGDFQCVGDDPARVADRAYHQMYEHLLRGLVADFINEADYSRHSVDETRVKSKTPRGSSPEQRASEVVRWVAGRYH
jgi:predicted ATPase